MSDLPSQDSLSSYRGSLWVPIKIGSQDLYVPVLLPMALTLDSAPISFPWSKNGKERIKLVKYYTLSITKYIMAIRVVEFSNEVYKIRKIPEEIF